MELLGKLSLFLMNSSIAVMILALVGMFIYRSALMKGRREKAKIWVWVTFCSESYVATLHAAMVIMGIGGVFTVVVMVLWGWCAWRDWQVIRSLDAPPDEAGAPPDEEDPPHEGGC